MSSLAWSRARFFFRAGAELVESTDKLLPQLTVARESNLMSCFFRFAS